VIPTEILVGCNNFRLLTGAEMYVYELTRELAKRGHSVVITSPTIGGLITEKSVEAGVKVYQSNKQIPEFKPDIIHISDYLTGPILTSRYPKIPCVSTIHSEFPMGNPFVSERIKKYICIRESIIEKVVKFDRINRADCIHIPNGFDIERFKPVERTMEESSDKIRVLFVGTVDKLRQATLTHLQEMCEKEGHELQLVGLRLSGYMDGHKNWIKPDPEIGGIWDIEKYVHDCTITAGILLGRTTIEGWLCGKPGIIYDLNIDATIKSVKLHPVPKDAKEKYDIVNVTNQIEKVYEYAMG
jgi:hypothetical protein